MEPEETARKIRQARLEIAWSQYKLAFEIGISDKTLSSYEVGRIRAGLPILQKIAKAVGKPVSFFTDEASPDYVIETKLKKIEKELEEVKKILQQET